MGADDAIVPSPVGSVPSGVAERVVREFWRLMASNDFGSVAAVLAEDLVVEWPQPFAPPEHRRHLAEPLG